MVRVFFSSQVAAACARVHVSRLPAPIVAHLLPPRPGRPRAGGARGGRPPSARPSLPANPPRAQAHAEGRAHTNQPACIVSYTKKKDQEREKKLEGPSYETVERNNLWGV